MATQSAPPPSSPSDTPENQGPELSKTAEGDGKDVKGEIANEASREPVFAIPQPIREDQVQNAVKFLSHPRVRGSPIIHRRSFLERKGLTKEEIDEAFRRVPDPPPNAANVEAATTNQAVQPKSSTTLQPQASVQTPQPAAAPASGVLVSPSLQQSKFHWSHALLATGVLAATGAGTAVVFKNVVVPKLKSWIRKVVAEESESDKEDKQSSRLAEEAAEAAKAAASSAAVVAEASQELLNAKHEERKYFEAFMVALDVQVKEMKSMGDAIRKLESTRENSFSQEKLIEEYIQSTVGNGPVNNSWRTSQVNQPDASLPSMFSKQVKVNGVPNMDFGRARPSSTPASVESIPAPHTKPFMEDINDMHPSLDQPPKKPVSAPRPKPYWEVRQQPQQKPSYDLRSQSSDEGLSSEVQESIDPSFQMNEKTHETSEPWWRGKTSKITETEPKVEEPKQLPYGTGTSEGPSRRRWVPPQPPTVAVPEAAAAIRHPKPSAQKLQSGDEQSVASSDDGEEKVMRAPDTAFQVETSSVGEMNQTEIQEERADGIEVN
ncbi:peroxisomal membrane protein PEX14-like isoform X2 [Phoenix dactylifera]|uniref:Peroxisomal membrane protein PEX14 n=1 Tax=Phoenix dactylifera TaxID=42345 RepID=A0A8B7BP18_PHODC|nr:peroxisomal membrane protein PEX14-like isoform X2 [Phoenix dactylifera]